MLKLTLENVIAQFDHLSGCSSQQTTENLGLIENSYHMESRLLDDRRCTAGDISRAEYAAAACAFYDYVCKENARNKLICTLSGKASADVAYESRVRSARCLKESALEAIRPVTLGTDFLFKAMEG